MSRISARRLSNYKEPEDFQKVQKICITATNPRQVPPPWGPPGNAAMWRSSRASRRTCAWAAACRASSMPDEALSSATLRSDNARHASRGCTRASSFSTRRPPTELSHRFSRLPRSRPGANGSAWLSSLAALIPLIGPGSKSTTRKETIDATEKAAHQQKPKMSRLQRHFTRTLTSLQGAL